jgi:hypothetical protein
MLKRFLKNDSINISDLKTAVMLDQINEKKGTLALLRLADLALVWCSLWSFGVGPIELARLVVLALLTLAISILRFVLILIVVMLLL